MSTPRVVAVAGDLMDRSRLEPLGVRFVARLEDVPDGTEVLVVDLHRVRDLAGRLPAVPRVVGYGSHVDRDTLDAARAAGVGEVYARSEFFRRAADLLGRPA